jgi:hypothetical protein
MESYESISDSFIKIKLMDINECNFFKVTLYIEGEIKLHGV